MRLKTITAPTIQEGLRLIKSDFGRDAVILSTKKIKGPDGKLGLEITAAIDEPAPTSTPLTPPKLYESTPPSATTEEAQEDALTNSLRLHGVAQEHRTTLSKAGTALKESGFSHTDALEMVLAKKVRFKSPAELLPLGKIHAFIGPTGAGKTTMLTKTAIQHKTSGASIGLMSLDNVKIGGFTPLEVVATTIGEQAHLLKNKSDLKTAATELGKRQLIFIDTPGLNPYDKRSLVAFHKHLHSFNLPIQVHLVLPAHLNAQDLLLMPLAFAAFEPVSVIFTKLDETAHFGGVLNTLLAQPLATGLASNSPQPSDGPVTLTAPTLANLLCQPPKRPWEVSVEAPNVNNAA